MAFLFCFFFFYVKYSFVISRETWLLGVNVVVTLVDKQFLCSDSFHVKFVTAAHFAPRKYPHIHLDNISHLPPTQLL